MLPIFCLNYFWSLFRVIAVWRRILASIVSGAKLFAKLQGILCTLLQNHRRGSNCCTCSAGAWSNPKTSCRNCPGKSNSVRRAPRRPIEALQRPFPAKFSCMYLVELTVDLKLCSHVISLSSSESPVVAPLLHIFLSKFELPVVTSILTSPCGSGSISCNFLPNPRLLTVIYGSAGRSPAQNQQFMGRTFPAIHFIVSFSVSLHKLFKIIFITNCAPMTVFSSPQTLL